MGDLVVVTNPEFVVRVGYPMSYEDAFKYIEQNHVQDIEDFLDIKLFKIEQRNEFTRSMMSSPTTDKNFSQIMHAMAKMYLDSKGHGGRERTIHTVTRPEMQGKVMRVYSKSICKTGTYYPPWSECSYEGEWDGGPGGLDPSRTHVLLEFIDGFISSHELRLNKYAGTWIESCNVRKHVE